MRDPLPVQDTAAFPRSHKERAFKLALPAFVSGRNERDEEFAERTRLSSVSSEEATLRLNAPVKVGTKLMVSLSVPPTSLLGKPLHLALSGTVHLVKSDPAMKQRNRLISLQLEKAFRIIPVTN